MTRPRRSRLSFRTRLTVSFAGLMTLMGGLLVAGLYLYMRYVPVYQIAGVMTDPSTGQHSDDKDWNKVTGPTFTEAPQPREVTIGSNGMSAVTVDDSDSLLRVLLVASIIVLVLAVGVGTWLAWIIAGRILAPLQSISAAAREAGRGRLDHRLNLEGPEDELKDLGRTFDTMLDRLKTSFTAHERFTSAAAHELRTPLAATKATVDVALAHPDKHELVTVLGHIQESNDASIDLVQTLLDLTALEPGTLGAEEPVDLANLAEAVLRGRAEMPISGAEVGPGEPGAKQAPSINGLDLVGSREKVMVNADPGLMTILLGNLVDNAVKYNESGGRIELDTGTNDSGHPFLRIANTGPITSAEQAKSLTEPLYRAHPSLGVPGHGLGLAMVASIARAHHANLDILPREAGGLSVTLTFTG